MLIDKDIEIRLAGRTIAHYESLGYEIPRYYNKKEGKMTVRNNTKITVSAKDLPRGSRVMVDVQCDYCGDIIKVRYSAYIKQRDNDIKKDCCKACTSIKNTELNLLRYGVENQFQREEIKEKSKNTNILKYGYDHPVKSPKILRKIISTMSTNGNIETSRQQTYIYNVLGECLNYNDNTTGYYSIDVALPKEKIAIEYDGSGHDLQVKFGNVTKDEFFKSEIIRSSILRRNGWREITIVSRNDWVPSSNMLECMLDKAKEHFANGFSWITFDIDESLVETSNGKVSFDYGNLRKIYSDSVWHLS